MTGIDTFLFPHGDNLAGYYFNIDIGADNNFSSGECFATVLNKFQCFLIVFLAM
ncbi:hypothetical protein [Photorhabdus luminescens]|uniref:hypothetical protein n=1 Tax=Photorhabdus luminescens TaxID=29488 RepID=UPI00159ED7F5|nr:hypothetical protein [Photorhabdus luminescens]